HGRRQRLRQVHHVLRPLLKGDFLQVLSVQPHGSLFQRQQACQGLEQGGLAAAIGAKQGDQLTFAHGLEAKVGNNRLFTVGNLELAYFQHGDQLLWRRNTTDKKKGTPTSEVT